MQVYKSNIYWFRITKATMNVMDGFSLNKITNPYFIYLLVLYHGLCLND